jgi:cell division septation protein DedD
MNHLLDADQHEDTQPADREISLGPATILGIFFALALLCAVFFGFGYSLGRKSAQGSSISATASNPTSSTLAAAAKPTAGSLAVPSKSSAQVADPVAATPAPAPTAVAVPVAASKAIAPSDTIIAGDKPPTPQPATGNPQPATSFVVQVAAVSTQDIADIELSAQKKFGYDVHVRREPQDQLLHVQIGPFANRKDAEAMRQNVLSHGFNAIVK